MSQPSLDICGVLLRAADADLDRLAPALSPSARQHVEDARWALLRARQALRAAIDAGHAVDEQLRVEVVSPGAERVDAVLAEIPPTVLAVSPGSLRMSLHIADTIEGAVLLHQLMQERGWRENAFGYWHRPGHGAAADVIVAQERAA